MVFLSILCASNWSQHLRTMMKINADEVTLDQTLVPRLVALTHIIHEL